jgi:hypothetical protein
MMKIRYLVLHGISFILFNTYILAQETPDHRNVWSGGQSGYVVFGDMAPLLGQQTFYVLVDPYIPQMGAAYQPDSVYVATRVNEWNAEKEGKGDQWLSYWNDAKNNFQPAFVNGMNVKLAKAGIKIGMEDSGAEYTLLLKTKHMMEFMGSIYVVQDIYFLRTENPGDTVAHVRCPVNAGTMGREYCRSNYEMAYYTTGVMFGRYLYKVLYK